MQNNSIRRAFYQQAVPLLALPEIPLTFYECLILRPQFFFGRCKLFVRCLDLVLCRFPFSNINPLQQHVATIAQLDELPGKKKCVD